MLRSGRIEDYWLSCGCAIVEGHDSRSRYRWNEAHRRFRVHKGLVLSSLVVVELCRVRRCCSPWVGFERAALRGPEASKPTKAVDQLTAKAMQARHNGFDLVCLLQARRTSSAVDGARSSRGQMCGGDSA